MKLRNLTRWLPAVLVPATMAAALMAGSSAQAAPTRHSPSPAAQTCRAFAQWNHHRTTANLDAMLTASERAPWANLGNDVDVVYADVRGGNHLDLAADVSGIRKDC